MKVLYIFQVAFAIAFGFTSLAAIEQTIPESTSSTSEQVVNSGTLYAQSWLESVDKGDYAGSWDRGSNVLKLTLPKNEWLNFMQKTRQPLGNVINRSLTEQRVAENPPGIAAGLYLVLVYKTEFSNKPNGQELLILVLGSDGEWKTMSYFVKSE